MKIIEHVEWWNCFRHIRTIQYEQSFLDDIGSTYTKEIKFLMTSLCFERVDQSSTRRQWLFTRCIIMQKLATDSQLNNKVCKRAWEEAKWPEDADRGCFVSVTVTGHPSTNQPDWQIVIMLLFQPITTILHWWQSRQHPTTTLTTFLIGEFSKFLTIWVLLPPASMIYQRGSLD